MGFKFGNITGRVLISVGVYLGSYYIAKGANASSGMFFLVGWTAAILATLFSDLLFKKGEEQ